MKPLLTLFTVLETVFFLLNRKISREFRSIAMKANTTMSPAPAEPQAGAHVVAPPPVARENSRLCNASNLWLWASAGGFVALIFRHNLVLCASILFALAFYTARMHLQAYAHGLPSFWKRKHLALQLAEGQDPHAGRCRDCGNPNCTRRVVEDTRITNPWEGMQVCAAIDENLTRFISQIFETWALPWHSAITNDETDLSELKVQVRFMVASCLRRFRQIDTTAILEEKVIPIVRDHVLCCLAASERVQRQYGHVAPANRSSELVKSFLRLQQGGHVCLRSLSVQRKYYRLLVDRLLPLISSPSITGNRLVRTLLRELLVTHVVQPTVALLSDPDFLNIKLAQALSPEVSPSENSTHHRAWSICLSA